jgi:hypothetical protein
MLPYLRLYSSKQEGAKSGKLWGWGTTAMFLVAENCCCFYLLVLAVSMGLLNTPPRVLRMLYAQFLKHKKQYFFLHCIFKRFCFWIYNFLCKMLFGRKWTGWMDGWLPGYYYIYYRVTLYNRMHTNLQYIVLSCISL